MEKLDLMHVPEKHHHRVTTMVRNLGPRNVVPYAAAVVDLQDETARLRQELITAKVPGWV
jgi:hypothetical protein